MCFSVAFSSDNLLPPPSYPLPNTSPFIYCCYGHWSFNKYDSTRRLIDVIVLKQQTLVSTSICRYFRSANPMCTMGLDHLHDLFSQLAYFEWSVRLVVCAMYELGLAQAYKRTHCLPFSYNTYSRSITAVGTE